MSLESEIKDLRHAIEALTSALTGATASAHQPTPTALRESLQAVPLSDEEVTGMTETETSADASLVPETETKAEGGSAPAPQQQEPVNLSVPTKDEAMARAKRMIELGLKKQLQQILGQYLGGIRVSDMDDEMREAFCRFASDAIKAAETPAEQDAA